MSQRVLVLGATSGIARAVASRFAARGDRLVLAGRNREEVQRIARDLEIRYELDVQTQQFGATDLSSFGTLFERSEEALGGGIDGVLLCHGVMMDDLDVRRDPTRIQRTVEVNLTSMICFAEVAARNFEVRGSGWIAAVSSVAGDRGRQSNYVYGCTKAALTAYLQGLRNRLHPAGVHVLTVKPGFVLTALTEGILDPESPLVATPDRVARDVVEAIDRRRDVIYTPWFWGWIMAIIRLIPEALFKRLKL